MKKLSFTLALIAGLTAAGVASAQVAVGQPVPSFTATDSTGKRVSLADYKGKYVVLEWINLDCPFTKKHYATGNMAATQKIAAAKGAAWLSINTSAKGDGAKDVAEWVKEKNATPTAVLQDSGKIGKAYGAKTTPHMYIIDPAGKLAYVGAIDSMATSSADDIPKSVNYVTQALNEATAGKPISMAATKPYGCSVKYGD